MDCRAGCGACCIAPSISSALPTLPHGKPAGIPCPELDTDMRCRLFGQSHRPRVCGSLQPSNEMCGTCREDAMHYLTQLEVLTSHTPFSF